ncbi:hypothetical protein LQ757_07070 [Agromyces sp. SYSU K20354]|uniref:hypothetical protein n=1 Tax=Agromyces cavernae TaxID=2898659 RepID=UPI001E3BC39F|nr:hypothetical protein [Agromyces cavernae]MCD2442038.1 hypothetical protein [Agromyces cavernae]
MPTRSLPTVIGPTENALRALLTATLSTTRIDGYVAWVVLNAVSRAQSGDWRPATAKALKVPQSVVDDVAERLERDGLLTGAGVLTDDGTRELEAARSAVARATSRVVAGIDDADQEQARRTLDQIRRNAEAELMKLSTG